MEILREFQENIRDNLMKGNSTVVIAPTGLGKTLAAILPFIESSSSKLGTRIVYSLPIRALAKGVYEEFKNRGVKAIVHHGEEPESNIFSERAIITTVDQYFTTFAGAPLSWSFSTSHAAAGAALTSYAVFDEIHLLNPKNGLQLLFAILKLRSRWNLPTTVMTATLPNSVIDFLESKCGLKRVEASEKDINERDGWRKVNLTFHEEELDVDGLARLTKEHYAEQKKIIVFVNTVDRAIELYKQLNKDDLENKVLLAHSRFSKKHRRKIENEIHAKFGRNSDFDGILVTTQVAEAGLNISAPLVITELAPMDSLIQRAGRCARFRENSGKVKGEVIVVKPKVERWWSPYFDGIVIKKGGKSKREDPFIDFSKEKRKKDMRRNGEIFLSEITELVLLEKLNTVKKIKLNWSNEKSLVNLALNNAYSKFIEGSDVIYFKDGFNKTELGMIIEKYSNNIEE